MATNARIFATVKSQLKSFVCSFTVIRAFVAFFSLPAELWYDNKTIRH